MKGERRRHDGEDNKEKRMRTGMEMGVGNLEQGKESKECKMRRGGVEERMEKESP